MSGKVVRCDRCRRRYRGHGEWNADYIAGLIVGHLCPECQTPQEDLDAELELILTGGQYTAVKPGNTEALAQLAASLVETYPTPEIMRDKADRLAAARRDKIATSMVRLMRRVADSMESGELWEE